MRKICFAASSGGHLEQLMMLTPLMKKYDSIVVTEETTYEKKKDGVYYLKQVNRREHGAILHLLSNTKKSLDILKKEDPDFIITTGVLAVVPLCLLAKMKGKKLIYIESFAKVNSGTMTGKLMYKFADLFLIQWKELKHVYPKAVYVGSIY